jgi:hypothetical protein
MRDRWFAVLVLVSFAIGCGKVVEKVVDAAPRDTSGTDTAVPVDAPPDAPNVACTHVPSTTMGSPVLAFAFAGGTFESFGCAPIDPTYWLSGAGMSVSVAFNQPQARPSIRVWGMNTDDTAAVAVNGMPYSLGANTASFTPKVVCGLSPGANGVAFVNGLLAGANTPAQGNFSYQDVTLQTTGVTSIRVTGMTGAGWGFAGASVGCSP